MNGILFGNRIFADIIKLKFVPTGLGWTRIQYLVSLLGEESLDTEMLLQKTGEEGGVRVMMPQTK